jgi:hypothetical protein
VFDKLEKLNIQQILDLSVWKNSDSIDGGNEIQKLLSMI